MKMFTEYSYFLLAAAHRKPANLPTTKDLNFERRVTDFPETN